MRTPRCDCISFISLLDFFFVCVFLAFLSFFACLAFHECGVLVGVAVCLYRGSGKKGVCRVGTIPSHLDGIDAGYEEMVVAMPFVSVYCTVYLCYLFICQIAICFFPPFRETLHGLMI